MKSVQPYQIAAWIRRGFTLTVRAQKALQAVETFQERHPTPFTYSPRNKLPRMRKRFANPILDAHKRIEADILAKLPRIST
jgi:hypothetical protein